MSEYDVEITATTTYVITVHAESVENAEEKALNKYFELDPTTLLEITDTSVFVGDTYKIN